MSDPDNVVKMPNRLNVLAGRADKAAHAYEASRASAIASIIEYGTALLEARAEITSNQLFAKWVTANGLDKVKPFDQQQERTAAMKIAELSVQGKVPWTDCPRSRPTDVMSWWRSLQRDKNITIAKSSRKRQAKADAAIADLKAAGQPVTESEVHRLSGVSASTVHTAVVAERTRTAVEAEAEIKRAEAVKDALEVKELEAVTFTKAQTHHIEAKIKALSRQLEKEAKLREESFNERVRVRFLEEKNRVFPDLQQRENDAFRAEENFRKMMRDKAIFTEAEFSNIRLCLHPDNSASEDKRKLAFVTFNLKKLQLTGQP